MFAVPWFLYDFYVRPSANVVRDDSCALAVLFPMTADALESIYWPDVFVWNWFQWMYASRDLGSRHTGQGERSQQFKPERIRVRILAERVRGLVR